MTSAWKLSAFALAVVIGYLVRRLIERHQERQRERAVLALGAMSPPLHRRSRKRIENQRAAWAFGALTGWAMSAYLFQHGGWEAIIWGVLGTYGLLDTSRLNRTTAKRVRKRSR